jgi:hypothetical protein
MKKLIITIITLLSLNIANAQFDPFNLDEVYLTSQTSLLDGFPTSYTTSSLWDVYVGNAGINQVNYINGWKSYRTTSAFTNCRATKFIDATIVIDLIPVLDIEWNSGNLTTNRNSAFLFYKRMFEELGLADPDFYRVTSISFNSSGIGVAGSYFSTISKLTIHYKKAIAWDCDTYGY